MTEHRLLYHSFIRIARVPEFFPVKNAVFVHCGEKQFLIFVHPYKNGVFEKSTCQDGFFLL